MRSLRVKDGASKARQVLSEATRLIRGAPLATLEIWLLLALLPALLKAFLTINDQRVLMQVWASWLDALMDGQAGAVSFGGMISATLSATGRQGLWPTLFGLLSSLVLTPLLLSSLALLYNNFVLKNNRAAFSAIGMAARNVRGLIFVALACMLAQWFVQMVPSLVSGLLSLLAEMLSWIPVLGSIANVLAIVLSILVSLLTDFAVVVIFCYVWICAACENVSGFGALVRSWQLTRNAMGETIFSLIALMLLRWALLAVMGLLWLFLGRPAGLPIETPVFLAYAIGSLHTVGLGAVTTALYRRRPFPGSPRPSQFRTGKANLSEMKRANID